MYNNFILKDVQLQYACLAKPADTGEYASNKYEVRVVMTKEQAKMLKDFKLARLVSFRQEDGDKYSTVLRSNKKPRVVDMSRKDLDQEALEAIGNGTVANVKGQVYQTQKGNFLGLEAVVIKELKEYRKGLDEDLFDGDDSAPFSTQDDDDDLLDD